MAKYDWARIFRVFEKALAIEPHRRRRFLKRIAFRSPELAEQAVRLIEAHENAGDFLEGGAVRDFAPVMPRGLAVCLAAERSRRGFEGAPRRLGPYLVLRQLGRGGMSRVYLGESPSGRAAIKIGRADLAREVNRRSLAREARALARFDHPLVARLVDSDSAAEDPWLAMERAPGEPLDRYCDVRKMSIAARLYLFLDLCRAVAHIHRQGVLHRDLKPGNVLVASAGRRPGALKVIDFGAAVLMEEAGRPSTMPLAATPAYSSPEALQSSVALDRRLDVFGLGATLYRLLTGWAPFQGPRGGSLPALGGEPVAPSRFLASLDEAESRRIAACRSSRPCELNRLLQDGLDQIALAAMSFDRAARFSSADELAREIWRLIEGRAALLVA